jgi:hypothetical protein
MLIPVHAAKVENLSEVQQLPLRASYRLGHLGFDNIQALDHAGFLPKQLATCPKPLCSSCQFGKGHWTAAPSLGTPLDVRHLNPSDCVCVDQL